MRCADGNVDTHGDPVRDEIALVDHKHDLLVRLLLADELEDIWDNLMGWREREALAASLSELSSTLSQRFKVAWALMLRALRDRVAAVREAAISIVSTTCSL